MYNSSSHNNKQNLAPLSVRLIQPAVRGSRTKHNGVIPTVPSDISGRRPSANAECGAGAVGFRAYDAMITVHRPGLTPGRPTVSPKGRSHCVVGTRPGPSWLQKQEFLKHFWGGRESNSQRFDLESNALHWLHILTSHHPSALISSRVVGVGVSISAFQAGVPGSSPGRRIVCRPSSSVGRAQDS